MRQSWLPPHVMRALGVLHVPMNTHRSKLQEDRETRLSFGLVDPATGRDIARGCPKWPHDPDLRVDAERLATVVSRVWDRWQARAN